MLRSIKLPRGSRCLVLTGFASSMWISLAGVAFTVFMLAPPSWGPARIPLILMASHIMVCTVVFDQLRES